MASTKHAANTALIALFEANPIFKTLNLSCSVHPKTGEVTISGLAKKKSGLGVYVTIKYGGVSDKGEVFFISHGVSKDEKSVVSKNEKSIVQEISAYRPAWSDAEEQ